MRLYLDDDSTSALLTRLLRNEGHDVQIPAGVGLSGDDDPVHLRHAALDNRAILTGNHDDFLDLHRLVIDLGGHHAGILVVCRDNDPNRDMPPARVARTLRNMIAANVPIADQFIILNHWR
jgi:hypothetical protein